jgi:hypothetical protein
MKLKFAACVSLLLVGLAAPMARAGSMELFLQPVAWWNDDFSTTIALPAPGYPGNHAGYYELLVTFTADKAPGDKGWLNTAFSVATVGSGLELLLGTWAPINPLVDTNAPPPGVVIPPPYAVNGDHGPDQSDLQSIVISLANSRLPANHPFDRRNEIGTPNGYLALGYPSALGSFFVHWDGLGHGSVELTNHAFMFSLLSNTAGPEQLGAGASLSFGELPTVPEPAGSMLFSLAIIALCGRVRRR